MSDHDISLYEFVYAVRAEAERYVHHPASRQVIHEWVSDMFRAADKGDAAAVARLTKRIRRKIRLKRLGRIEDWLVFCSRHHPRLRRWVNAEIEAELAPLFSPDWRAAC
jgi:hypothetical protein